MPVLPKSLLTIGGSLKTARMIRRLRRPSSGLADQEKTLRHLTRKISPTSFGQRSGVQAEMTYDRFRSEVPLHTYEQLIPYIERMKRGERDVLWPGTCSFYAVSSGTTAGRNKFLPMTEEMLAHFNQAAYDSLLYYCARVGHAGVFRGRHLFLGGSTTLAPIPDVAPFVAYSGDLGGLTALNMPLSIERHLYEPGPAIAQMADWQEKIAAIVHRTLPLDISLVAGIPTWLLILADELRNTAAGSGNPRPVNLQAIWPNLECLVHGGIPVGPYYEELRRTFGPTVNFHEVFPSTEGFIAAQDATPGEGLRLMTGAGLFFEFLRMSEFEQNRLPALGTRAVPLAGVNVGEDYALVLTTPAGLCRYVTGDVVRFISTDPARLIYVGRTKLQLSAFGEHVIEKELTDSLLTVCQDHGWSITHFHVAPLFTTSLTGQTRGRHEWWIELRPGTQQTPTGPVLGAYLDQELMGRNDEYHAKRKTGGLDAPVVRLVMPGVFEHWMRHNDKWGGMNKMPRCRSDRAVADGLGQVARFTADQ